MATREADSVQEGLLKSLPVRKGFLPGRPDEGFRSGRVSYPEDQPLAGPCCDGISVSGSRTTLYYTLSINCSNSNVYEHSNSNVAAEVFGLTRRMSPTKDGQRAVYGVHYDDALSPAVRAAALSARAFWTKAMSHGLSTGDSVCRPDCRPKSRCVDRTVDRRLGAPTGLSTGLSVDSVRRPESQSVDKNHGPSTKISVDSVHEPESRTDDSTGTGLKRKH